MNMPHKISQRILSSDCKSIFRSDLQCYSLPRKWPIWYGNYALKKITIFFLCFFVLWVFFQKISALQEKYSTFPSYSLLLQALLHKKTFKNKYFTLLWIIFRNIFWIFGAKNNYFQERFSVEKKEKKKSHQLTLTSCQNWQWSNWWVVDPDFYSTLGGSGPLTGPPPP